MARGVMVFADGKGRHRNPAPFFWLQRKTAVMFTGSFATGHHYLILSPFPFFPQNVLW